MQVCTMGIMVCTMVCTMIVQQRSMSCIYYQLLQDDREVLTLLYLGGCGIGNVRYMMNTSRPSTSIIWNHRGGTASEGDSARTRRVWARWQLGCWVLSRWDDVQVTTRRSPRKWWWYIVIVKYKETIVMIAYRDQEADSMTSNVVQRVELLYESVRHYLVAVR